MKKEFNSAKLDIIKLNVADVVSTSGDDDNSGDLRSQIIND